jgi:hypothetical protein
MFKLELDKGSYHDFVLTDDYKTFNRDINTSKLFYIDVTENLCDNIGNKLNENSLIKNISLTGYDNFFIKPENALPETIIDPEVEYQFYVGDSFCLHEVSGYTKNIKYEIEKRRDYIQLNGGFYQGFFKLLGYPVEFFPSRMRKGWTVNMLIHTSTGLTTGTTLNNVFNNSGFIFYLGTRAENKFSNLTNTEIIKLKDDYSFNFLDTNNLYTVGYFKLNGTPYTGYFNYHGGLPYSGRLFDPITSVKLEYNDRYGDILDNAFGVRITPDGRIGYRTIYATDPCYTGETENVSGVTNNSFIDFTTLCDDFTIGKIITKYFTVEESYTKKPIVNLTENNYLLVTVTFERDFSYDNSCQLKYGDYKKGTLSILLNGFTVYKNHDFNEIIPHELDVESKYQEGVPFSLSYGGGTQGLYEAVYLDTTKSLDGVIEKFFAGTFLGGVKSIEMYSTPLYTTEIRDLIKNSLSEYNLYQPKGGRRVFIIGDKPIDPDFDMFSIFITTDSIDVMRKIRLIAFKPGYSIDLILAAEINGFKQTIDIPVNLILKQILYFNYVTEKFDTQNRIDEFTISEITRGNVTYKRYIYNKSDRGEVLLKLLF